jgi:NarL family two-component system response regulator YdfI
VIRVLIAAPSAIVRAGLESLVRASPALELVGSDPDVVLADLESPQEEAPPPELLAMGAVVLLVSNPLGPWTIEALRSGVRAVLPRDISAPELIAAIEAAAAGLAVLHPADLQALLPAPRAISEDSGEPLTPREIEVFAMLAEGAGKKQIAWKLAISEHTVKFHVASIMSKLNAASRTEAVAIGIRKGLIML